MKYKNYIKKLLIHSFWVFLVALALPAMAEDLANGLSPIKIKGDSVEYFYKINKAEGRGNVQIDYGQYKLFADEIDVNLETKEAWARGNVILAHDGGQHTGKEVYVDFETGVADIDELNSFVEPFFHGGGHKVNREKDGDSYTIEDAYLTTCDDGQNCPHGLPPYQLEAKEVIYYPNDKLIMKHVIVRIRHLPVMYIPIMVLPLDIIDEFPIQLEVGKTSEWGGFALSKLRYYINDDHDGNILNDYRENQGYAGGIEHYYRAGQLGAGALRGYYADDQCGDNQECSRSKTYTSPETERYRLQARHTGKIADNTALNFEFNKLSDEYVIQDFFYRDEYERIAFPDNYVSVIHSTDNYTLSGLARYRLDDFFGVVQRLPEIRLDTHTKPLGESNFYYRSQTQAAWLNKTYKDFDESDRNDAAARIDADNRLSYVWRMGAWTATPFIASHNTFYSRDRIGDDTDFVRNNLASGVDISSKYFKVYDVKFNALGMKFDKLRHIFTPNISYFYQSRPTHKNTDLIQFDSIDTLDRESHYSLDLENKFQIKYKDEQGATETRNLLRSLMRFDFEWPKAGETRLDLIETNLEFYPTTWMSIDTGATYQFETDQFDQANIDLIFRKDAYRFGVGQRYVNGDSNQLTLQGHWQINPQWKIEAYNRYDFTRDSQSEGGENNEFELVVEKRNFYCWTISLIYNHSHEEDSFFVTFAPTQFSTSSFRRAQSYRRVYQ